MKYSLYELKDANWNEVWHGEFEHIESKDDKALVKMAFSASVCNYIMGQFPEGFGLTSGSIEVLDNSSLSCMYNCSGRNVLIKYRCDGTQVENRSVPNKTYKLIVKKDA